MHRACRDCGNWHSAAWGCTAQPVTARAVLTAMGELVALVVALGLIAVALYALAPEGMAR